MKLGTEVSREVIRHNHHDDFSAPQRVELAQERQSLKDCRSSALFHGRASLPFSPKRNHASEPVPPFRKGGLGGIFRTWHKNLTIKVFSRKSPPAPLCQRGERAWRACLSLGLPLTFSVLDLTRTPFPFGADASLDKDFATPGSDQDGRWSRRSYRKSSADHSQLPLTESSKSWWGASPCAPCLRASVRDS